MNNPLISVIVPVYNVEKYLDRCVESLVNQTYKNIEIILVDDGSPDNCPAMCDKWAQIDNRIKVIHKENGGLTSARNAGIACCQGQYLSFVDSDDWTTSDYIEHLYTIVKEHCCQLAIADFLSLSDVKTNINNDTAEELQTLNKEQLYAYLSSENCYLWGKLYDKKLFESVDFPEELSAYSEDIAFNYELAKNCEIAVVTNYKLYYYYRHSSSIMSGPITKEMIISSIACYDYMGQCIEGQSETIEQCYTYARIMHDFFLLNSIIRNNKCTEYYDLLKNDIIAGGKLIKRNNGIVQFTKMQIYGYKLLKFSSRLYNASILIRKRLRGY